jgi:DedD protein
LIGAVTLVALLVVFVPMLLDSEPSRARKPSVPPIPSKDTAAPLPAPPPATASVPGKPQAATVTSAPAKVEPAKSEPAKVEPKTQAATSSAPGAAKTAAPADAPRLVGFAVQVGAFRDEEKLKQAREKLTTAGVVHYTERLEAKAGPLTRLRAGPYANREAAEAALVTIKRGALDGKVVALP